MRAHTVGRQNQVPGERSGGFGRGRMSGRMPAVAVSRADRRLEPEPRVVAVFGEDGAARLAVTDWRDLEVAAAVRRNDTYTAQP
jgi:hypothetical protein